MEIILNREQAMKVVDVARNFVAGADDHQQGAGSREAADPVGLFG